MLALELTKQSRVQILAPLASGPKKPGQTPGLHRDHIGDQILVTELLGGTCKEFGHGSHVCMACLYVLGATRLLRIALVVEYEV